MVKPWKVTLWYNIYLNSHLLIIGIFYGYGTN